MVLGPRHAIRLYTTGTGTEYDFCDVMSET
jgi:hypothetical protein